MPPKSAVESLVELALAKPEELLRRLPELAVTHEPHAISWAHGLALRELGRFREAEEQLDCAVDLARDVSDIAVSRIRTSRAVVRQSLGDIEGALEDTEWAALHLEGADAGRNESQRGLILQRLGRNEEALSVYERALPLLERHGDGEAANRLRSNRAAVLAYQGRLGEARDDLQAAADYGEATGDPMAVASAEHNLGFLEGRAGNIPAALEHFSRAANLFGDGLEAGRLGILVTDRAETLADAGLFTEALELVHGAIAALEEAGAVASLAEAQLLAARVHALAGQPQQAQELAAEARANFETLGQTGWSGKAAWIEMMATYEAGDPVDAQAARELGELLATQGWHVESHLLLLQAADAAVDEGDLDLARALVRLLRGSDRNVPAMVKVGRHRAIARTRLALGDRAGARRAITAALKLLHEHRVTFGSAELRAHASRHGHGLSQLALDLALGDDRPDDALVALDLIRDTEQPVWGRPHADPEVAADLEELRRLDGRLRDASREGIEDTRAVAERAVAERRIRDRLRRRRGRVMATERLDVPALHRALGDRVLRSWFVHEGRLGVVTVDDHGRRLQLLGPVDEATDQIDAWRFALRRLVDGSGSPRRLEDAAMSATAATARLTELLGLDDHPSGRPLVVVPTGPLRGIAWPALPALAGCQVSVVPSARHWLTTHEAIPPSTRVLVAAGPGLAAAVRETEEIAARHRDSVQLADGSATADAVVAGLGSAAIGHLAAHGSFRWDNPLFSALQFADGPVWLHDFERLGRAPHTLVLSSCDMAMDRVVAGDAVLGMASGLLQLGVASLIAPVVPVPDEEVADFMIALHERMAAGATGSEALAATAAAFDGDTPRRQAVRQSFVAFGA